MLTESRVLRLAGVLEAEGMPLADERRKVTRTSAAVKATGAYPFGRIRVYVKRSMLAAERAISLVVVARHTDEFYAMRREWL
jgi:hypothetical protein